MGSGEFLVFSEAGAGDLDFLLGVLFDESKILALLGDPAVFVVFSFIEFDVNNRVERRGVNAFVFVLQMAKYQKFRKFPMPYYLQPREVIVWLSSLSIEN